MKHNRFACQRNRWPRVLVVAILISLNLTPVRAQDLIPQRAGFPCRFCPRPGAQIEPQAGRWKTWVLSSGSQFRLPPPPDGLAQEVEVGSLITRAKRRDAAALNAISFWDAALRATAGMRSPPIYMVRNNITGPRGARILSLLNVAIYDATIAAWDSKYVYNRPRPSEVNSNVAPAIPVPNSPSYPSEHAAAAGAAAAVLGYLFPNDAQTYANQAQECGESRLNAGVQFPSDVSAGLELGRKVAELVIASARRPTAPTPSSPARSRPGQASGAGPIRSSRSRGTWRTWVISSGSEFRPPPPPAFGSAQLAQELAEVKNFPRPIPASGANFTTTRAAYFWQVNTAKLWNDILTVKLFEYQLDRNPPRAARAYALMSIAAHDALIACWDGKYTYWAARPNMLDPTIVTLFPNPNHPILPVGALDVRRALRGSARLPLSARC